MRNVLVAVAMCLCVALGAACGGPLPDNSINVVEQAYKYSPSVTREQVLEFEDCIIKRSLTECCEDHPRLECDVRNGVLVIH